MNVIVNNTRVRRLDVGPSVFQRAMPQFPTTRTERFLLMGIIVLLPAENYIPTVAGLSIMRIAIGVLAGYILLNCPRTLARTSFHPLFLAAYVLLVLITLIELSYPNSSYFTIFRIGQMFGAAILVASLCRDRVALRTALYGYVIAGTYMSVLLFLSTYGPLQAATATNFNEASMIRSVVLADQPLNANLNTMGFIVAQGAVVALAFALTTSSAHRRNFFLAVTALSLVSTFLPMSRSAIVIAIVSCAIVMQAYGVRIRTILIALLLGVGILLWVPEVVLSRLTFSTEAGRGGTVDARARIYMAAIKHFPKYALTGVGVGNSHMNRYNTQIGGGTHNAFLEVTVYWGLAAFLALIAVVWQAYRSLPKRCGDDGLALCLLGIAVGLLLLMMVSHNFYNKEFALGLGVLVGARCWIWSKGIVRSASPQQRRFRFRSGDTP